MDLHLVIAGGLFSLGGVLLGGLLSPLTQLFLEWKHERRTANQAKLLIAGEMLQAQLVLRSASTGAHWPYIHDVNISLPTSAWRENRASIAGKVSEDLWLEIVMAYVVLEIDRSRFALANKLTETRPLSAEVAKEMKKLSDDLGHLRRQLGIGGGWVDERVGEFNVES